jgi:sulfotransferase
MNKTYYFMAGLPRSGSTVLSAILNQHPQIYSSPQTDLLELMYTLENKIPTLESYRANLLFDSYQSAISSLPDSFYQSIPKPVVIDKNRAWGTPYNWDNLSSYLNPDGKVILTMRPILEVLASFLKVAQKTEEETGLAPFYNPDLWVSSYRTKADAQVDNLMALNGKIDQAIFSIANLIKNHRDKVHLVWFDDLLSSPKQTLKSIYDFLEMPPFSNDFDNIQEVDSHNDFEGYGLLGLHDIKKKLEKPDTCVSNYLSDYAISKYGSCLDFLEI